MDAVETMTGVALSRDAAWGVRWFAELMRAAQLGGNQAQIVARLAATGDWQSSADLVSALMRNSRAMRPERMLRVVIAQAKPKLARAGYTIVSESPCGPTPTRYRLATRASVERAA